MMTTAVIGCARRAGEHRAHADQAVGADRAGEPGGDAACTASPKADAEHGADEQAGCEHAAGAADADGQAGGDHLADQEDEQERRRRSRRRRRCPAPGSRRRTSAAGPAAAAPRSSPPTAGRSHSGPRQTRVARVLDGVEHAGEQHPDAAGEQAEDGEQQRTRATWWTVNAGRCRNGVLPRAARPMTLAVTEASTTMPKDWAAKSTQDQLHREEHPGQRGVEGGRDAAGRAARDQDPHPRLGHPDDPPERSSRARSRSARSGPSRPTDPPPPMHSAEARALTAGDLGGDPAAAAGHGVHHLGYAVAAGLAGEEVHERAVEQPGHHRRADDEPAARAPGRCGWAACPAAE